MQRRGAFLPVFVILFLLSLLLIFFSQKGLMYPVAGLFEQGTVSLQRFSFGMFAHQQAKSTEDELRQENARLLTELAKQKEQTKENKALRDQFETPKPVSTSLLPAEVIGTQTNALVIDKGLHDNLKTGDIVVYKETLVGTVIKVSQRASVVQLITAEEVSFTAETTKTETEGVIKGASRNTFLLDNVLLSEKLEKGDVVVTRGDRDEEGDGLPPELVVGKIISVNKKASDLFQTAEVRSLVDLEKLEMVFVIKE